MYITLGSFKGRKIRTHRKAPYRPTPARLREAFFQSKHVRIKGARFLDVFAGTGIMGFYALSCGAVHVTFIEQDARVCREIRKNLELLGIESKGRVLQGRVEKILQVPSGEPFDLVYFSPPYRYPYDRFSLLFQVGFEHGWWNERSVLFLQRFKKTVPPRIPSWVMRELLDSGEHRVDMYVFCGKEGSDVSA